MRPCARWQRALLLIVPRRTRILISLTPGALQMCPDTLRACAGSVPGEAMSYRRVSMQRPLRPGAKEHCDVEWR